MKMDGFRIYYFLVKTSILMTFINSCINGFAEIDDFRISHVAACPESNFGYDMTTQTTLLKCVSKCEKKPWCKQIVHSRYLQLCGLREIAEHPGKVKEIHFTSCIFVNKTDMLRQVGKLPDLCFLLKFVSNGVAI